MVYMLPVCLFTRHRVNLVIAHVWGEERGEIPPH